MGLWLVDLVVFPTETLRDTHCPPLFLPKKLQCALAFVVIVGGDGLQHRLGKLHMAVLELAVGIPGVCW